MLPSYIEVPIHTDLTRQTVLSSALRQLKTRYHRQLRRFLRKHKRRYLALLILAAVIFVWIFSSHRKFTDEEIGESEGDTHIYSLPLNANRKIIAEAA